MSKKTIDASKLKSAALSATGRQTYGLDEYIYIKSFSYDDNNAIKVRFYVLLKTGEGTYDLMADLSTPDYGYSIADGKAFTDIDGHKVYKIGEDGEVIYQDVEVQSVDEAGELIVDENDEPVMETVSEAVERTDDFTRNFAAFAALIIPSIFVDVNNFLGYHANENGGL
tara:strand:- start:541 stop:1047 length:507 start_codon:yes stop_codon:yes gene_type:complete